MKTNLPAPLSRALTKREIFTKALFTRPDSLSELLPYDEFLEKDRVFLQKNGSLGAVYEVELLEHEPMNSKAIVDAVEKLKSFFSLPENCTLQFLFDQSTISPFYRPGESVGAYQSGHNSGQGGGEGRGKGGERGKKEKEKKEKNRGKKRRETPLLLRRMEMRR